MIRSYRLIAVSLAAMVLAAACQGGAVQTVLSTVGGPVSPSPEGSTAASPVASPVPSAPAGGSSTCPASAPDPMAAGDTATVTIETAQGTIAIKVEADLGPKAAGNFVALASCGFYNGVIFHRVVPGFVIQGGDPEGTGTGGPGYQFADDPVRVPYTRGTVAMANAGPDTNGSQFFIVLADLGDGLAPAYSVFGHVVSGMEAVDAIAAANRDPNDRPLEPVVMTKVTVSRP